jgi:hypothetical protein
MTDKDTQLTSALGYNVSRMRFSEPIVGTIPESKPLISYQRILISTENEDGTLGDLIIPTETCFSFGLGENKNMDTGKINGFVLPMCLHSKDGATSNEKAFVDTINNIVEKCKDYIIENKEEIGQYELERNDLKKLNFLYYKKDKGKIVEGVGPTLYAKVMTKKDKATKQEKIVTMFYDFDDNPLDPLSLIGKYCKAKGAVKIESIFIGNKISIQVKLYEANVSPLQSGMPRLLAKTKVVEKTILRPKSIESIESVDDDNDNVVDNVVDVVDVINNKKDEDTGSLNASDDESPPVEEKKPVVKKVVRRTVKKTT